MIKNLNDVLNEIHYKQTKEYYYNLEDIYNLKAYAVFTKPFDNQKFFLIGGITKNEKEQVVLVSQPEQKYNCGEEVFYFFDPKQLFSFNMELEIFSRRKSLESLFNNIPISYKKAKNIALNTLEEKLEKTNKYISDNKDLTKEEIKKYKREMLEINRAIKTFSL